MSHPDPAAEAPLPKAGLALFPPSFPDELFASRPSRYHWRVGGRHTKDTLHELFGHQPGRLTQLIPLHLWPLAERLPGDRRENLRQFLVENTLFPIYSLFFGLELEKLLDFGPNASCPLPRRTVGLLDSKLCLACVKDDFREVGMPYLHRAHQVAGVKVCHRHAIPLIEQCPYCGCPFEKRGDLFAVPWQPCKCGRSMIEMPVQGESLPDKDPVLMYAKFVYGLLMAHADAADPREVAETYRYRLKQLDLYRGGLVSHAATIHALEEYYGVDELAQLDSAYRDGKRHLWLRLVATAMRPDEVPISRQLLLAAFLFQTSVDFLKALQESQQRLLLTPATPLTPRKQRPVASARSAQAQDLRLESYLEKIRAAIKANPKWTMKEVWKRFPGTLARILKISPAEFERLQQSLLATSDGAAKRGTTEDQDVLRDKAGAEKLAEVAKQLYASAARPERVSQAALLRGAGLFFERVRAQRYPLSARTVSENLESAWHFWARRYIWALAQIGDAPRSAQRHWKLSGLSAYIHRELVPVFSGLKLLLGLKEGQILEILRQYGIDREWEGPCPDRKINRGGRGYQRRDMRARTPTDMESAAEIDPKRSRKGTVRLPEDAEAASSPQAHSSDRQRRKVS